MTQYIFIPVIGQVAVCYRATLKLGLAHPHVPVASPMAGGEEKDLLRSLGFALNPRRVLVELSECIGFRI